MKLKTTLLSYGLISITCAVDIEQLMSSQEMALIETALIQ